MDYNHHQLHYKQYNFDKKSTDPASIEGYLEFIDKTGLKNLITQKKIKNLVDYMIGVEAGLDSKARKNRGGKIMEEIVEEFIKSCCANNDLVYLKEANSDKIFSEWEIKVPVDKSSRRYDFVIRSAKRIFIIETNFYEGGGSKLKATANEYQRLNNILKKDGFPFIWITDGKGWESTKKPLLEAFNSNDFIFNLSMQEHGILEYVVRN